MLMAIKSLIQDLRRQNLKRWIDENLDGRQAAFVEKTGINQGELSALLKDKSFGEKKARKLEELAGMPENYLDTDPKASAYLDTPMFMRTPAKSPLVIEDSDEGFVAIKRVDLKISAGISGFGVEYLNGERSPIFFRRDWIEKKGYNPDRLHAIAVMGESMEPSLYDGDLVVINTDEQKPIDGEVFAANYEGEVVIKRLIREAGMWYLASDNTDKRRYPNKLCHENCFIIGRIIYKQSERI